MNQVRSDSVSDQLKFGSGELRMKLTWIGLGTVWVKVIFGLFWGLGQCWIG